jgi:hypothetical protein
MDFSQLLALLAERKWIPLSALVVWMVVRLLKSDTKIPVDIPPRWRPVLAVVLGVAASSLDKIAEGGDWRKVAPEGLAVGVIAILVQVFGVDVLRGGKDVAVPKALSKYPPPPPPGTPGVLVEPIQPARVPTIENPEINQSGTIPRYRTTINGKKVLIPFYDACLVLIGGCSLFTKENARTVLDLSKSLCILANFASDDAAVQAICGVVDREVGPMKDLLRAERQRVSSERAAAKQEVIRACKPEDAGAR